MNGSERRLASINIPGKTTILEEGIDKVGNYESSPSSSRRRN